jgi:hypothetical protein
MMEEKEAPPTTDEVLRYAGEQLHSVQPQPAPILIHEALYALKAALTAPPEGEPAPKDFAEAISRIDAKLGKLHPPLKHKPDFKHLLEAARAAEEAAKPKHEAHHEDAKNKKVS